MALTDAERETVIVFDKESDMASVYTYEQRIISRLEKDMGRLQKEGGRLVEKGKYEGSPYARFEVPLKWIAVRPPKRVTSRKGKPVKKETTK